MTSVLFGFGEGAQSLPATQTIALPSRSSAIPSSRLPHLIPILSIYFNQSATEDFFTGACAFNDVQFTGQRPIVGVGHHFVVYASAFSRIDKVPPRVARVGGEVYCIKAPRLDRPNGDKSFRDEYYRTVLQELRVLTHPSLMNCEYVIGLLGLDFHTDYDDHALCWPLLLLEYSEFGTLDSFQTDMNGLDPRLARNLLCDIAMGLKILHDCNIIHGDVKSENALICGHARRQYIAKLSDFGMAMINPSPTESHYLMGCTWLWSAPEIHQQLSVPGLKLTDVYSFGLTAWRVLLGPGDPFSRALNMPSEDPNFRAAVHELKISGNLPQMVMQTLMDRGAHEAYVVELMAATLCPDPSDRCFDTALHALVGACDRMSESMTVLSGAASIQCNNNQTSQESDSLTSIAANFPFGFATLSSRPSVIYSLLQCLDTVMSSTSDAALAAARLYFDMIISPGFQHGDKSIANRRRILNRLQQLGSNTHRIMNHIYERTNDYPVDADTEWQYLQSAAYKGSYFALQLFRNHRGETTGSEIENGLNYSDADHCDEQLLAACQTGDWSKCQQLLGNSTPLTFPDEGMGPLHYLAMHKDEMVVPILYQLVEAGARLDQWEGDIADDDYSISKASGTPLHWAIMHRNLPVIHALTNLDSDPDENVVKRSFFLATVMHFHDALEILRHWAISVNFPFESEWISALFVVSAANLEYHLPRLLRHGDDVDAALFGTLDTLSAIRSPTELEKPPLGKLIELGFVQNYPAFARYFLQKLDRSIIEAIPRDIFHSCLIMVIMCGFVEMFEMLYEYKLCTLDDRFGPEKATGLQTCLITCQPNPHFAQRYLQWGCQPDEMGNTPGVHFTPFAMAVQYGLYEIANMLLRHGADKDLPTGWLGGTTPLFRMLHTWPDVPISRVRYMLEEIPRQGFGHVSFIGWPAAKGNLLYCFSMAVWSHYRNSYNFSETMKYILSMLHDKSGINELDGMGSTALNMAARCGNLEVAKMLIDAGADVHGGLAISPLNAAMEWRDKWAQKEAEASRRHIVGERRHATKVRERAEELIDYLKRHGAQERGFIENQQMMLSAIARRHVPMPSMEMLLEVLSGVFDRSSMVDQGGMRLHPAQGSDFIAHRGNENWTQRAFRSVGRTIDSYVGTGAKIAPTPRLLPDKTVPLYLPHSCTPWQPCPFANGRAPQSGHPQWKPQAPQLPNAMLVGPSTGSGLSAQMQPYVPFQSPSQQMVTVATSSGVPPLQSGMASSTATLVDTAPPAYETLHPHKPDRSVEAVQKRLQAALDPEDDFQDPDSTDEAPVEGLASVTLRRDEILRILETELSEPITLAERCNNIKEVIEVALIESTVADALGEGLMRELQVEFVPVLADDGRSVQVYVCTSSHER